MNDLTKHALEMLRKDPEVLADARQGVLVGNTILGSVMSLTMNSPRQYTEAAVRNAVDIIDQEGA